MSTQENSRLDYMAAELDALKTDLAEVKAMIKDMHNLLAGNPIDKESSGLIGEFKQVKKEFYTLKSEVKKYKAYFYAMITLFGLGVLKVIIDILKA